MSIRTTMYAAVAGAASLLTPFDMQRARADDGDPVRIHNVEIEISEVHKIILETDGALEHLRQTIENMKKDGASKEEIEQKTKELAKPLLPKLEQLNQAVSKFTLTSQDTKKLEEVATKMQQTYLILGASGAVAFAFYLIQFFNVLARLKKEANLTMPSPKPETKLPQL